MYKKLVLIGICSTFVGFFQNASASETEDLNSIYKTNNTQSQSSFPVFIQKIFSRAPESTEPDPTPPNNTAIVWGHDISYSNEELLNIRFNPILTPPTRTLGKGKFGFQNSVLMNNVLPELGVLFNAFTYGVIEGLEIGIAPIYYIAMPGSSNHQIKLNFYRTKDLDLSISFGQLKFDQSFVFDFKGKPSDVLFGYTYSSVTLGGTYRPIITPNMAYNAFYKENCVDIQTKLIPAGFPAFDSFECMPEIGIDAQYRINKVYSTTIGTGVIKKDALNIGSDDQTLTIGAGIAMNRLSKFISRPSIGFTYTPFDGEIKTVFSTTFYEH